MKKLEFIFLVLPLLLAGCSSDVDHYEYYNKKIKQLRNLPIADAEALFVTGDGKTRAGGNEGGDLYKITYNGETERVELKTETGEVLNAQTVCVIDLSEKYVYVQIAFHEYDADEYQDGWITYCYELIVRKTDGAIYMCPYNYFGPYTSYRDGFYYVSQADLFKHIRELHWRNQDIFMGWNHVKLLQYIQNDAAGNVYYRDIKISDNNRGETQIESLFSGHLDCDDGVVNPNGDILFYKEKVCRLNNGQYRTVTNNISGYNQEYIFVLPSDPNSFYWIDFTDQYSEPDEYSQTYNLYKYTTANSEMEGRLVRQITMSDTWGMYLKHIYHLKAGVVAILQDANKTLFANIRSEEDILVVETNVVPYDYSDNISIIPSDNYLYLRNENRISRIDPLTGTEKEIFKDSGYKVIDYYVSAGNSVIVLTLELTSGNEVLMEVSADGSITNLETYDGHRVFQLARIR